MRKGVGVEKANSTISREAPLEAAGQAHPFDRAANGSVESAAGDEDEDAGHSRGITPWARLVVLQLCKNHQRKLWEAFSNDGSSTPTSGSFSEELAAEFEEVCGNDGEAGDRCWKCGVVRPWLVSRTECMACATYEEGESSLRGYMRRKKLYEEEEFINTATNTAVGTMRRKQYTLVYHGPRDDYEARMGDDYIPNTERLGLSGPWRWVRTEAYSTDSIERLAVVPDSVHA